MAEVTKAEQDLAALRSTVLTICALITQLQNSAIATASDLNEKPSNVNALDLAYDTAKLIKAHSTKLSLLIINKPFTPTAITTILRELISGPAPGLASAVEVCNGAKYTKAMASEMQYRAKRVFTELSSFVKAIPLDGKILSDDQKNGTGKEKGKGSLANTGVLWQVCEGVMELKALGVAGLVIKKADQYRDLLKDALEELQEWGEEESDVEENDEDGKGSADEDEGISAQDAVDDLFGSQRHIPMDDPNKIRPRLESSRKRLRLVITMYQAVVKRRLKTLPHLPYTDLPPELREKSKGNIGTVSSLDEALDVMKAIPDITDELASAFYDLDEKEIDKRIDECFAKASGVVELLLQSWEGGSDEFTIWVCCFISWIGVSLIKPGTKVPASNEEGMVMVGF